MRSHDQNRISAAGSAEAESCGKGKGGTGSHRAQASACIQERDFPTFKNG